MNSINIAIISIYSFPIGLAPTNRILAYSKGLIENGATVDVYIPFPKFIPPLKDKSTNIINYGIYQGVQYYYTSGQFKNRFKIFRGLSVYLGYRKIKGYITSIKKIYQENLKRNYKCIIISSDSIPTLFIYSVFAKYLGICSIFIFDEYPVPIRHKLKTKIPKWKEALFKKVLKNISAYISISKKLAQYYNNLYVHKTHVLPVIIDVTRFNLKKNQVSKSSTIKYLCYMGNMELSKDDVDNIIRAFSIIHEVHPLLVLYLYGDPSISDKKYLEELIGSLGLTTCVFFKGKVDSSEVPRILMNAFILVSSQPDTVRASGGFPTKLGEYLASGTPCIITNVGENAKYVKDNVHLFFTEAGNPKSYAEKLNYIINNYKKALEVAKNGRSFVYKNYSHTVQGKYLLDFINSI